MTRSIRPPQSHSSMLGPGAKKILQTQCKALLTNFTVTIKTVFRLE